MDETMIEEHKRKYEAQAEVMRILIKSGCSIYDEDRERKSVLFMAIDIYNDTAVETIVQEGYDVNLISKVGTPLQYAVYKRNYGAAKILLENGANPNAELPPFNSTPLYTAVDEEIYDIADLLLQYGADPHYGSGLKTAYCRAGCSGNVIMFQMFERYGVDLGLDSTCRQLAELAVVHGRLEFALFYIRRINNIDWKFANGRTLLQEAAFRKDQSLMKRLINWGAKIEPSSNETIATKANAAHKLLNRLDDKNLPVKAPF